MSPIISDHVRQLLARSLPLVEAHREALVRGIEASFNGARSVHRLPGRPKVAAATLAELLLVEARRLVDTGEFADLRNVLAEHRPLKIDGRHYSRFGDALIPVLRDVLGPNVPREVAGAWCDAFWTIVRAAKADAERASDRRAAYVRAAAPAGAGRPVINIRQGGANQPWQGLVHPH
jgi:hemoglobin-like flavoprotein